MSPNLPSGFKLQSIVRDCWKTDKLLTVAVLSHAIALPLLLIACVIDPVQIGGMNGWFKPVRFAISGAIYGATFIWLMRYVDGWPRMRWIASNVTGVALIVETTLIAVQVIRRTTSHFNITDATNATIYGTMGQFIFLVSLMNLVLVALLIFQMAGKPVSGEGSVFAWSLRLGALSSFVFGMGGGFLMTAGPTPAQYELVKETGNMPYVGAHSVGVPDGGPGLPLLGWSTEGGDLRIGHFVGLHGMQILPVVGWLLSTFWARDLWSERQRLSLVWITSIGYMGVAAILVWQALRGQPLLQPDSMTLIASAVLAGAVALSGLKIMVGPGASADAVRA